ncbi:MAG TPA: hypothetical protein PKC54_13385 [Ferruginibacter sp.]|nr:hypothetical protein [Ferruginibacter sp.]
MRTLFFILMVSAVGLSCQKELEAPTGPSNLLPTITTTVLSSITNTTASGGGTITDDGGSAIIARGVCWSTSVNPVVTGNHTTDGTGIGSFSSALTGLTASTVYYVRAYATNNTGTAYGNEISFTTSATAGALPTLITATAAFISPTSATSGGHVTADGGAAVTARGICWSTSTNPDITGNHTIDGSGLGAYSSSMTSLTPSTTYYVRAYATNSNGTAYGNEVNFTTSPGMIPDVYAAGYESNGTHTIAKYWKNGVAVNLTSGTNDAEAYSIFIDGNDIYAAGWEMQGTNRVAKYWKNGTAVNLTNGTFDAMATQIILFNNDVYVSGYEGGVSSSRQAKYWKNGTAVNLAANATELSRATSIAVSGTDVYVTVNIYNPSPRATIFKNGVLTDLSGGFTTSSANAVVLNGTDVYVAGMHSSVVSQYWKNGVATILPSTAALGETAAFSIFISGTDIYAAGFEKTPAGQGNIEVAKYWKNGVITNLTDATHHASANSIVVSGADIYAAGYEENASGNGVAKYWKNGTAVSLTNGTNDAEAFSIVVK